MAIRKNRSAGHIATFLGALAVLVMSTAPASAQVKSVDPDTAIDGDLSGASPSSFPAAPAPAPVQPDATSAGNGMPVDGWSSSDIAPTQTVAPAPTDTYRKDDLIGAAEGVFGKGAEGLATMIEDILAKQGEPNAYITGREAGGAIAIGVRYGSGTLHHKVEGNKPIYWTGPSVGFDLGANAGQAFVLVYNLYDSESIYKRFVAGEGQAYLVGGFNVSYLRRGSVVLIPVRMGAGLRLGANIGYMKFSNNQNWLPF
jgi:hypothetical protein